MKKFLILGVLSVLVVTSMSWAAEQRAKRPRTESLPPVCAVLQPDSMVLVKHEPTQDRPVGELKEYRLQQLKQFKTIADIFEDIRLEELDEDNNLLKRGSFFLPLRGARSEDFAWLLRAADPNADGVDRQLPVDLKGAAHKDRLVALYKLAIFLDPADKKTLYPMTLEMLKYIKTVSQDGNLDDNPRYNFLTNRFKATDVVEMLNNYTDILTDSTYPKTAEDKNLFDVIRNTDYLLHTLSNKQLNRLLPIIRQQALVQYEGRTIKGRIERYLEDVGLSLEPIMAGEMFSVTVQDLIDVDLLDRDRGEVVLHNRGLTSLEGLQNITEPQQVRYLDLAYNNLQELPAGIFDRFDNINIIYLNNNQLERLPAGLFNNLHSLGEIRLNNNRLTVTEADIRRENPQLPAWCLIEIGEQQPQ